jgi:hypothetical protein
MLDVISYFESRRTITTHHLEMQCPIFEVQSQTGQLIASCCSNLSYMDHFYFPLCKSCPLKWV